MSNAKSKPGRELERRVADAYRAMGARKVEHDVELAGNQIDVYVELETPGRLLHRIAVEAKDWASTVGIDVVNKFAVIVNLLRGKGLIDEGVIVSAAGFSKQARNAARDYSIRLLEPADLDAMVTEVQATRPTTSPPSTILTAPPTPPPDEAEQLSLVEKVKLSGQRVRGWLINVLQAPVWQGIGGVVAVLALMVAVGAWFWPDIRAWLFPAGPAATPTPTRTPAPITTPSTTLKPMPGNEVVIEMDGLVIDASDDRCQEVVCRSSPIIEAKVLDLTGVPLQPGDFSYNWRFDPPDSNNRDMLDSKNYATIYSVPCDRDSQMITIEVLRNGKTLGVRGICFNIERPP